MGYHLVDPEELDQWDDRPADVRALSAAAGYESGQAFFVDPGSPQRAFSPEGATGSTRVLAVGAPSVQDVHAYDPAEEE